MSLVVSIFAFFIGSPFSVPPATNLDAKLSAQAHISIVVVEKALARHQRQNPGHPFPAAGYPAAAKMIRGIENMVGECAAAALKSQPTDGRDPQSRIDRAIAACPLLFEDMKTVRSIAERVGLRNIDPIEVRLAPLRRTMLNYLAAQQPAPRDLNAGDLALQRSTLWRGLRDGMTPDEAVMGLAREGIRTRISRSGGALEVVDKVNLDELELSPRLGFANNRLNYVDLNFGMGRDVPHDRVVQALTRKYGAPVDHSKGKGAVPFGGSFFQTRYVFRQGELEVLFTHSLTLMSAGRQLSTESIRYWTLAGKERQRASDAATAAAQAQAAKDAEEQKMKDLGKAL